MMVLSFNHAAKAIMSWTFPASTSLEQAHAEMAKVAAVPPVSTFLIGAEPNRVVVKGHSLLDVAYWVVGDQVLVGVVNLDYASHNGTIHINLPVSVSGMDCQPWGALSWGVSNHTLTLYGVAGLASSFVVLNM